MNVQQTYSLNNESFLIMILISVNSETTNDNSIRDEERVIKEFDEVIMRIKRYNFIVDNIYYVRKPSCNIVYLLSMIIKNCFLQTEKTVMVSVYQIATLK